MYEPLVESARNYVNHNKIGRSYNVKVGESVEMYYNPLFHAMKPSIKSGAQFYCTLSSFYGGWSIVSDIIYRVSITIKAVITCI